MKVTCLNCSHEQTLTKVYNDENGPFTVCEECEGSYDVSLTKYVITGIDRAGKRFKPIYTNTPQHYNIWSGTLWEILDNGKRKKIKEYFN